MQNTNFPYLVFNAYFQNKHCVHVMLCVCVVGLSGGQLSQMPRYSILQPLTKATPSLLMATGWQARLDEGQGGKEDKPDKRSDV